MKTADKPDHLEFTLERFTCEEIETILDRGKNFRELRNSHRDRLLSEMRANRWEPGTGQPLVFDDSGKLLDGQHRLAATLIYQRETDQRIWFWCCRGASPVIAPSLDCGMNRKLSDFLKREGASYIPFLVTVVAGEARQSMIPRVERNTLYHIANGGHRTTADGKNFRVVPSLAAAIDCWKRNKGAMGEWAALAEKLVKASLPRPGLLAALGYQLAKVDETKAKLFFDLLISGAGLKETDPIHQLRKRFLADRANKFSKLPGEFVAALLIKAWVAWNRGETIALLRYAGGHGPRAEAFPDHRLEELATA